MNKVERLEIKFRNAQKNSRRYKKLYQQALNVISIYTEIPRKDLSKMFSEAHRNDADGELWEELKEDLTDKVIYEIN